jgi:hypothetical protein
MEPSIGNEVQTVRDMVNRFMRTEVAPVMNGYEQSGASCRGSSSKKPATRGCTARCSQSPLAARTWATSPQQ